LWRELGRPLDAARCLLVQGRLRARSDPEAAAELLNTAAQEYDTLAVPALADRARELVEA
ncbi:MAG: hypothetical protein ACRDKH_06070, partial [Solirubrobacterales bacterium]